jgi:CubicO group peptidase (beta-lactamase class C family)
MTTENEAKFEKLGEFASELMKKTGVPGLALGILYEGQVYAAGFGVTNVDHPLPVTDKTLFQIGSNTKTFTGMAIMRLVDMGKMDLDATVRTYIPEFKVADEDVSAKVTIRHLLTHTSGWTGDHFRDTGSNNDALQKYAHEEMTDLAQIVPLGAVWSYNNAGFYLAGYIIEKVTGQSYEEAIKELVLEPLGLNRSYFEARDLITFGFAVGHNTGPEGPMPATPWEIPRAARPAGGIVCDVHDLLRYTDFQMGDGTAEDGTEILNSETLTQMHTPEVEISKDTNFGLSWAIQDVGDTRVIFHGGGTVGQISQMMLVPEHKFAVVIFTNGDQGGYITKEVPHLAIKEFLGLEMPNPAPIETSEEELAVYSGTYINVMQDIHLEMLGGKLIAQVIGKAGFPAADSPIPPPYPPMTVGKCEADRLIIVEGMMKDMPIDVVRDADGEIFGLRTGARIHVRQQ